MIRSALIPALLLAVIGMFAAPAFSQLDGGAIAAIDEPTEAAGGGPVAERRAVATVKRPPAKRDSATAPKKPAVSVLTVSKPFNGPVIGDKYLFLNFEVISAEKPYHTRAAKAAGASGLVQVEVLIGTDGSVISARARTGNKLLHAEAERAALASKFNRPSLDGRPARAVGFLVYRFGPPED
ncbi:MAG: energy transducer TonB [Chloracidobacterium sp.]|nr:energy transducer TonB [Chloracidobacterium sp.]